MYQEQTQQQLEPAQSESRQLAMAITTTVQYNCTADQLVHAENIITASLGGIPGKIPTITVLTNIRQVMPEQVEELFVGGVSHTTPTSRVKVLPEST